MPTIILYKRWKKEMFLEKHEPASIEEFTWYDEEGNFVDSQDPTVTSQSYLK